MANDREDGPSILIVADGDRRVATLRQLTNLVLPHASFALVEGAAVAEEKIPNANIALVDGAESFRATLDVLRFLRARGFEGGVVVLGASEPDPALLAVAQSLGATCITRSIAEASPVELGSALAAALAEDSLAAREVAQARRIFAAGQAALSLQHSINNPLAALLAEAQLLQLEELSSEQHEAVDRMIELCRRIIALVRRLDVLASG